MELDRRACERAARSRDPRFDGRFFIGVKTTGIYCRPICPAPAPRRENVTYYPTAAAAAAAGLRPCLRCRPEAAPGTPGWMGTSAIVSRALRLIGEGALDESGVEQLALRVGVTDRHLRRLFLAHLGATPLDVAITRRLHFAKKLIDETTLPFTEVALAAGFGSVRRFNGAIQRTYARTPSALRRLHRPAAAEEPHCYRLRLAYRPPYDWEALLAFLRARAIPGVERADAASYRRTIELGGVAGRIVVRPAPSGPALELEVHFADPRRLLSIVERVRRVFDLGADPAVIASHLGGDRLLGPLLARHPGLRAPGAWDAFELAVRAILGQQISVAAASTMAGRLAARFGAPGLAADERLFPTPDRLAQAPIEEVGVVRVRAEAIRALARAAAGGALPAPLQAIHGVGEWTEQYVALRAGGDTDAFPSGDLVLRRVAGVRTARELALRAEAWRPWRAYAVILLWQGATDDADRVVHRDREPGRAAAPGRRRGRAAAAGLPRLPARPPLPR
jgi:AraC family transcriptional regulator, regulatory protein of adaptative response / DNA-3-methyladenine glycosylase II